MQLILASKSPYRKELLERLGISFDISPSNVDEAKYKNDISDPYELAKVLARAKAQEVLKTNPDAIIIGSDQLGHHKGEILGKPKSVEKAIEQLTSLKKSTHELVTSVCVISKDQCIEFTNITKLTMKDLSPDQISLYVKTDMPLQCAGSYMIEKSGIALFEKIETNDFNAIVGLPLIELSQKLKEFKIESFS